MTLPHDAHAGNDDRTTSDRFRRPDPATDAGHAGRADDPYRRIREVTHEQLDAIAARAPVRPSRPASTPRPRSSSGSADVVARARAYLAKKPPSISGSGGHDALMDAARDLVYGFDLSRDVARDLLLADFNPRCVPEWSEREIEHKLIDADTVEYGKARGHLADARPHHETPMSSATGTSKPKTLRNYAWDEVRDGETMRKVLKGRSLPAIASDLANMTDGWPKRVGSQLFAIGPELKPLFLRSTESLFAWIGSGLSAGDPKEGDPVDWNSRAGVNKSEFRAYLEQHAERYDGIELVPHEPAVPGLYYAHPPLAGGSGAALDELASLFHPATEDDRDLIVAYFLTLVWGGEAGERPMWVITSEDDDDQAGRGVGKTKLATAGAKLVGGFVAVEPTDDFARIKTRLLSPDATGKRVVLIDNVKSLRFSWAELEGLITADTISGHVLHVGEGSRPNLLSVVLTANSPALSSDLAKRAIIIKLKRPVYDPDWLGKVNDIVVRRRLELLGDCVAVLQSAGRPITASTRWACWGRAVVSKFPRADEILSLLAERQRDSNEDDEEGAGIREAIVTLLAGKLPRSSSLSSDPERVTVLIESKVLTGYLAPTLSEKVTKPNQVSRLLGSYAIRGLHKSDRKGRRLWRWTGDKVEAAAQAEYVLTGLGWEKVGDYLGSGTGSGGGSDAGSGPDPGIPW